MTAMQSGEDTAMTAPPSVTLVQMAERLGRDRSNVRKVLVDLGVALGIEPHRIRTVEGKGQPSLAWRSDDADRLVEAFRARGFSTANSAPGSVPIEATHGTFYVILLVPELSRTRVKLGFAQSLRQRFADHRTACPTATVERSWPCKAVWEAAAIASISRSGCTPLSGEVFDCDDLDALLARGEAFFGLMPKLCDEA